MRLLTAALVLTASVLKGGLVTVSETIRYADGTTASGKLRISWQTFTNGVVFIGAGYKDVSIGANGAFSVTLYDNATGVPSGTSYRVDYDLNRGVRRTAYWIVPNVGSTTISAIETITVVAPTTSVPLSQIAIGGATSGSLLYSNGSNWVNTVGLAELIGNPSNTTIRITGSSAALLRLRDSGGTANNRDFDIIHDGGNLIFRALNDDASIKGTPLQITYNGISVLQTVSQTLTASPTTIAYSGLSPKDGMYLVVWATQDGTGGRNIVWDSSFHNGPTSGLDTTANTVSMFFFSGRSVNNKWWLVSQLTGLSL